MTTTSHDPLSGGAAAHLAHATEKNTGDASPPSATLRRATRQLPAGHRVHAQAGPHAGEPAGHNAATPAETPEQAFARGLAEGESRANARHKQQADALSTQSRRAAETLAAREKSLATAIAALEEIAKSHAATTEETLVRLTLLACGQVLQHLVTDHALVTQVVQAVVTDFGHENGVELLLNTADHAALPANALTGLTIAVRPADNIAPGEFRVCTPHRQLDLAIARQYQNLCGALRHDTSHDH